MLQKIINYFKPNDKKVFIPLDADSYTKNIYLTEPFSYHQVILYIPCLIALCI